jgi:hypothetical protein
VASQTHPVHRSLAQAADIGQSAISAALLERVVDGQAEALRQLDDLIDGIRSRAQAHRLDRGFRLSLPYFDDGTMSLREREFEVIPFGRIPFVPGFVALAGERELARVEKDRRLTEGTRQHLKQLLGCLRFAFGDPTLEPPA